LTAILCYAIVSYTRLYYCLRFAVREGNIWRSEAVETPMVLGIFRPQIYLPFHTGGDACILAHEQAHIARGDHIVKPLAFLILCVHWFNPLVWMGYGMMSKDMEGACDERVLKAYSSTQRKEYAACLLDMGARHSGLAVPLAFGESDTAGRIKRILNDKKPAFWLILAILLAALALCVTLLSNPPGSTSLLDADDRLNYGALERATLVTTIQGEAEASSDLAEDVQAAITFIQKLQVQEEPASKSKAADRDHTNRLRLFFPSGGEGAYSMDFNFSADYSEVWIHDGVKPGLSFLLADPAAASAYFAGEDGTNAEIIGGADGPTAIYVTDSENNAYISPDESMAIYGMDLSLFTWRQILDENPTYYIAGPDVVAELAKLPVSPYMIKSSLTVIGVSALYPSGVEEIRLSHTLLDAEGQPLYYKPNDGGSAPLDEEGELIPVGTIENASANYTYTLQPSALVALSSKMQPFPEGALRCFSLRYRISGQWYECCFVLRTDEGMYNMADAGKEYPPITPLPTPTAAGSTSNPTPAPETSFGPAPTPAATAVPAP
ncbi:MAG: hypothetical protein EOM66_04560, partial [Clostridia bacterium]|nr:hypothetical protein [Clostridia bacterium]